MKKETIADLEKEVSEIDLDAANEIFEITDGISAGSIDASDGYRSILEIILRIVNK